MIGRDVVVAHTVYHTVLTRRLQVHVRPFGRSPSTKPATQQQSECQCSVTITTAGHHIPVPSPWIFLESNPHIHTYSYTRNDTHDPHHITHHQRTAPQRVHSCTWRLQMQSSLLGAGPGQAMVGGGPAGGMGGVGTPGMGVGMAGGRALPGIGSMTGLGGSMQSFLGEAGMYPDSSGSGVDSVKDEYSCLLYTSPSPRD